MTKVRIRKCGISSLDGDVVVAEIDRLMNPLKGIGQSIWNKADLKKEDLLAIGELKDGQILLTPPNKLENKFGAIIHVVLQSIASADAINRTHSLIAIYKNILEKAISIQAKTIILPFIGIHSLSIPEKEGVDAALVAIRDFLIEKNDTGIEQIIICTSQDTTYTIATRHEIFLSPIMKGKKTPREPIDESRFDHCVVAKIRADSNAHRGLAIVDVRCGGLIQSLLMLSPDISSSAIDYGLNGSYFGAIHEADLIMSRLGQYSVDWSSEASLDLKVCTDHLNRLSRDWRNAAFRNVKYRDNAFLCSFPEHHGVQDQLIGAPLPSLSFNPDFVEKADAIRWMKKKGTVIQLGIPICAADKAFLRSSEFDEKAASQETRELELMMETDPINFDNFDNNVNDLAEQMDTIPRIPKKTPSTAAPVVKDAVNNLLEVLKVIDGVGSRRSDFVHLSERQKRNIANSGRIALDAVCEVLAPHSKPELKDMIMNVNKIKNNTMEPFKRLLMDAAELYERTDSKLHRIFILSSVASLELTVLQQFFPGLSPYMHKKARRVICNPVINTEIKIVRVRYEQRKVDRLLGFLLSPLVVLNLPFDERTEKMDDGSVSQLPNFMRLQTIEEVYRMYEAFMIEEGEKGLLLMDTTAKGIIHLVAPTRRKNLTCVDEKIGEGMRAFDDMFNMISDLEKRGYIIKDTSQELTKMLQHSKSYLRGDYKAHIKEFSNCADHCATYALSDPNDMRLSVDCMSAGIHAHSHNSLCDRCELVKFSMAQLKEELEKAENATDDNSEREYFKSRGEELEMCESAIFEMKKHQIRAAVSHGERADFVEKLTPGVALLTLDFAQKFEPLHAREKQSEYFAKTGISYHICHALTVNKEGQHAEHYSVHIAGPNVSQDGCAVSMITDSFLRELKEMGITTCIIRADNAGCYRNGPLMYSLINMQKTIGMQIEGFLFSEAQAGKSACDRGSSMIKTKARDVVTTLRSKIDTKENFFQVLTTGTLLRGVSIHLVTISEVKKIKAKIPNITSYSSFSFENSGIRLRRHRSIGEGIVFDIKKLTPCEGKMVTINSGGYTVDTGDKFWITRESEKEKDETTDLTLDSAATSVSRIKQCPEDNCIDDFISFRELDKHISSGKHTLKLERKTLHDYCAKMISNSLDTHFSIATTKLRVAIKNSVHNGLTELKRGWALRTILERNIDDQPTRELIRNYFKKIRKEGKKCTPNEAEMYIKNLKKPGKNGALLISPKNRLSLNQIKSIINGELRNERDPKSKETKITVSKKKNDVNEEEIEDEEEYDDEYDEKTDDEADLEELVKNSDLFEEEDDSDNQPLAKHRRLK